MRNGAFRQRLNSKIPSIKSLSNRQLVIGLSLENISHFAQICLAIVAIFGYFYTVRPIYQKERLEEQVARFEGIISKQGPQIKAFEKKLSDLQRERGDLLTKLNDERTHLTKEFEKDRVKLIKELETIEHQLLLARNEKAKIEKQIQYMTFRYRLPDGSPAVTDDQVHLAQGIELRKSFRSALFMRCSLGGKGFKGEFPTFNYSDNKTHKDWPFLEQEIEIWKAYGTSYPLKRAVDCIETLAQDFKQREGRGMSVEVDALKAEAIQYANNKAEEAIWAPPFQPQDLIDEFASKNNEITKKLESELKKVEDEYGNWQSILLPDRREIFKHNYKVGKQNAQATAISDRLGLQYDVQKRSNSFRTNVREEVSRLLKDEMKK